MSQQDKRDTSRDEPNGEKASIPKVEALFSEFAALYGSRFTDMWRHTDVSRVKSRWAGALSGLETREIRAGLRAGWNRPWPPSLPEFLGLCRPEPDPEKAFFLAQEQLSRRPFGEDVWPEKALFWAAVAFGFYDLRSTSWTQARNRWTRLWQEKRAMEKTLPPVPEARPALVEPGKTFTDRTTARRHLAELKQLVKKRTQKG